LIAAAATSGKGAAGPMRNTPPPVAATPDATQQDLVRRLSEFVSALSKETLATTTLKDGKSALMQHFIDFDNIWKRYKSFIKEKLEDLLNEALEKFENETQAACSSGLKTAGQNSTSKLSSKCTAATTPATTASTTVSKALQKTQNATRTNITQRMSSFMAQLPAGVNLESVTLRQIKDALKPQFHDWVSRVISSSSPYPLVLPLVFSCHHCGHAACVRACL
jgi:hypothetical protein